MEEKAQQITLEDRVQTLEKRIRSLEDEIYYASQTLVGQDESKKRTTLKGKIDEICEMLGLSLPKAPWHF